MTTGFLFWLLMILWAIFGIGGGLFVWRPNGESFRSGYFGGNVLLLFVLLFLLGWRVFGFVIQNGP